MGREAYPNEGITSAYTAEECFFMYIHVFQAARESIMTPLCWENTFFSTFRVFVFAWSTAQAPLFGYRR